MSNRGGGLNADHKCRSLLILNVDPCWVLSRICEIPIIRIFRWITFIWVVDINSDKEFSTTHTHTYTWKDWKILLTWVGIEPTTFGFVYPTLYRLSYQGNVIIKIFPDCYQQPLTTSSLVGQPVSQACSLPTSNSQIIKESCSSEW